MNLEEMKKKFESGSYIAIFKCDAMFIKWSMSPDPDWLDNRLLWKLIHKKHKHILDAYLEDNNVDIEVKQTFDWEYLPSFIENYQEYNDYRLKPKQTDLNNTWCEATQENYDKLVKMKCKRGNYTFLDHIACKAKVLFVANKKIYSHSDVKNIPKDCKQIKLNSNNEFEYVEENRLSESETEELGKVAEYFIDKSNKPKNNFADFGFEADFEGEILSIQDRWFVGYARLHCGLYSLLWDKKDGECVSEPQGITEDMNIFNLTQIRKAWYEDESNVGKLVKCKENGICKMLKTLDNDGYIKLGHSKSHNWFSKIEDVRPATEEEVLSLLMVE